MARLIYIALGCALATLVVGFVVRTSNVPLLVSCGFSVVALVLMFRGWSKRLRESGGVFDEPEDEQALEELEIATIDADTTIVEKAAAVTTIVAPKTRPETQKASTQKASTRKASKRRPKLEPIVIPDPVDTPEPITTAQPIASSKPKPKPKPKPKAAPPMAVEPRRRVGAHVFVIPGRSRYHAQGCRFVKSGDVREVTEATAKRRGYVACSVCLS